MNNVGQRKSVVELRNKFPCLSMTLIAKKTGISRERVRQILKSESLITEYKKPHLCKRCGNEVVGIKDKNNKLRYKTYCSEACKYKIILVSCFICGTYIYKKIKNIMRSKVDLCSQKCRNEYLAIMAPANRAKKHKLVDTNCVICGTELKRNYTQFKNHPHSVCSTKCWKVFVSSRRTLLNAKSDGHLVRSDV